MRVSGHGNPTSNSIDSRAHGGMSRRREKNQPLETGRKAQNSVRASYAILCFAELSKTRMRVDLVMYANVQSYSSVFCK
jgi:hypothetical protein